MNAFVRLSLLLFSIPALAAAQPVRTVADDTGARVPVAQPCRIVSLAPGTTAMLYAAGAGHCLVGTIAHSNEPAEAAQVPVVGDSEALDFEQLLALRPSAVVVAVDVVQRMRIDRIRALGIPVYQVHVTSLSAMPTSLRRLGEFTGTRDSANREAARLAAALEALSSEFGARSRVRVLYQLWDRPIYTVGTKHVITDALRVCGASNVFGDLDGIAAPAVTREAVLARDPEVIIASAPAESAARWLEEWRRFPALSAVRAAQLVGHSDERLDRMGPSVIAATGDLCDLINRARAARAGR